ncbi:unnamed protein product, partial [Polarella glacialis]
SALCKDLWTDHAGGRHRVQKCMAGHDSDENGLASPWHPGGTACCHSCSRCRCALHEKAMGSSRVRLHDQEKL